jgi:hypothetical protein
MAWKLLSFVFATALLVNTAQAQNVFSDDVQMCSGHPWIDVRCNGALGDGNNDDTSAINTTISAAITASVPVYFPAGTYKVTSKITIDYQGISGNGLQIISSGATVDGRSIASGNVLQLICSGGTTGTPAVCNHLRIAGSLTVSGNGAGYVVVLGKTDFSDQHNAARIEHLVVTNNGTGGAIQANYLTDGDLWLSGSTAGGSASVGAVALEQVQASKIGGWGSAAGASAPALLVENGASVGNAVTGFAYDPNSATCVSITTASAQRNAWVAPYFPCVTAVNAPGPANQNAFVGPTFAGTNLGPTSGGVAIIGRGSLNRFVAPSVASYTAFGVDDGTIFSAANAIGPATQFTAASLPITLPTPAQVGVGWSAGFVSDNNKAVVLTAPASSKILLGSQQFTTLIVGASGTSIGFETAVLESDGSNFRVTHLSQGTALLNGAQTTFPARWIFPGGPGYQATLEDNANVISSAATSASLAVTLPPTNTIPVGWMVAAVSDASRPLSLAINSTNGGTITSKSGATLYSIAIGAGSPTTLQFDGTTFRVVVDIHGSQVTPMDWGCVGDGVTDDTACVQAAINGAATAGVTLTFDGQHLYKTSSTVTMSTPGRIEGQYRYGEWVANQPTGPGGGVIGCTSGILNTSNGNVLSVTAVSATVRYLCIQASTSNSTQATAGAAMAFQPPSLVTYQAGVDVEFNTIIRPYDGITINGIAKSVGCCGQGSAADGATFSNNTIINPADIGISVGKNTAAGVSVGLTMVDNTIICGSNGTIRGVGVALYDGGINYDGTQNGPFGCNIGFEIIPGTISGVGQNAQLYARGVLGDSSITYGFLLRPQTSLGAVEFSEINEGWVGAANTTTSVPVLISNINGGIIQGVKFVGGFYHSSTNQSVPVIDIEGNSSGTGSLRNIGIIGTEIDCWGGGVCSAPLLKINGTGPGQPAAIVISGNHIGNNHQAGTSFGTTGLAITGGVPGYISITGNDFSDFGNPNTPIAFTSNNTDYRILASGNAGIDDLCNDVVASAATVAIPNMDSCFHLSGTTTVTAIGNLYTAKSATIIADSGLTLSTGGPAKSGAQAPFCNGVTLTAAQAAQIRYNSIGACVSVMQ